MPPKKKAAPKAAEVSTNVKDENNDQAAASPEASKKTQGRKKKQPDEATAGAAVEPIKKPAKKAAVKVEKKVAKSSEDGRKQRKRSASDGSSKENEDKEQKQPKKPAAKKQPLKQTKKKKKSSSDDDSGPQSPVKEEQPEEMEPMDLDQSSSSDDSDSDDDDESPSDEEIKEPVIEKATSKAKIQTAQVEVQKTIAPKKIPKRRKKTTISVSLTVPKHDGATIPLACGDNEVGQLGVERAEANRFLAVSEIKDKVVNCAAGGMHSLLLTENGQLYSFGCNDEGSLGRQTDEEEDLFKPGLINFGDNKIAKISAGNVHSVAITVDGQVFLWGSYRDTNGPFGLAPKQEHHVVEPIKLALEEPMVDVACGSDHTLLLSAEGKVFTLGCAEHGKLGRIKKSHCCRENRRAHQVMLNPSALRWAPSKKSGFDRVWAGRYCSFIRSSSDGKIYGFGLNNFHQLGVVEAAENDENFVFQPVHLEAFDIGKTWEYICGGEQHTLALDSEGTVYSMGRPLYGRLGLGKAGSDDPDVTEPKKIPDLEKSVVAISAGDHCSFALDKEGKLWSWGQGSNILGQGNRESADETDVFVPTICSSKQLNDKKVLQISAGSNHTLCLVSG